VPVVAVVPAGHVPAGVPVAEPTPDAVLDAVQAVWTGARDDLLLLTADDDGERVARGVRLVLGATHLAVLPLRVPPTAFFVLATALQMLPPNAAGLAPALVEAVAGTTWTRALLSSVSALERPAPSIAQDLASRVPGSTFLVDWTAQTVGRSTEDLAIPAGAVAAVVSASEKPVARTDRSSWPVPEVVDVASSGSFWGASRWLEVSLVAAAPAQLVARVVEAARAGQAGRCPSCGRVVAGASCVFCQVGLSLVGAADGSAA
jgi:hypothetical protein